MTPTPRLTKLLKVGSGLYARISPEALARVGWKRRDLIVAVPGPGYIMLKRVDLSALAGALKHGPRRGRKETKQV